MKVVAQQDVQIRVEAPKDFAVGIRVYPIAERLTSYRESVECLVAVTSPVVCALIH